MCKNNSKDKKEKKKNMNEPKWYREPILSTKTDREDGDQQGK